MNITAARWAVTTGAPTAARFVLVMLAHHAPRDAWRAYPSLSTLAEETGLTERSVTRSLGELETAGLIAVTRIPGRGNSYALLSTDPRHSVTPDTVSPLTGPLTETTKTPDTVSTKGFYGLKGRAEPVTVDNSTFLPGSGWIRDANGADRDNDRPVNPAAPAARARAAMQQTRKGRNR